MTNIFSWCSLSSVRMLIGRECSFRFGALSPCRFDEVSRVHFYNQLDLRGVSQVLNFEKQEGVVGV